MVFILDFFMLWLLYEILDHELRRAVLSRVKTFYMMSFKSVVFCFSSHYCVTDKQG